MEYLSVFRSVIDTNALIKHVLSQYDIGENIRCHLITRGISDTHIVSSTKGKYYLRVGTSIGYGKKAVEAEVQLIQHLAQSGITTLEVLPRHDGQFVTVIQAPEGKRIAILTKAVESIKGEWTDAKTEQQTQAYGKALAKMHLAADTLEKRIARPEHDYHYFIAFPLQQLRSFQPFEKHHEEIEFLAKAGEELWQKVASLPKTAPYFGICHGDAMIGNSLLREDGEEAIIDFDYSGYGWRIYDIATLIWSEVFKGYEFFWDKTDKLMSFLNSYHQERAISPEEYALIPTFAALRQYFLFGAAIKNAPAFGIEWHTGGWFNHSLDFIKICLSDEWYEKSGLPRSL